MMEWVLLIHALVFLLFWLTNFAFQQPVNQFLADATGMSLNYVLVFIIFTVLVGMWSLIRLILRARHRKAGAGWPFMALAIFYLLFFYGSFTVLFLKNPVQLARLGQLVVYFRIFPDVVVLFLAAWGIRKWLSRQKQRIANGLAVGVLIFLWLIPVFCSPGSVYRGSLPPKPLLIAHRGASMLAPENTLASMRQAADLGVHGLETDIDISRDGTLFLMHDSTLARTTNVNEVFPTRSGDPAVSFTREDLQQLSAGDWFVEQDPFGTIASGLVSQEQAQAFRNEPIPLLNELLTLVRDRHVYFIYDLRIPPDDNPFAGRTLDLCLEEIGTAGIASQTWVLATSEEIIRVRAALPEATLAAGIEYEKAPSAAELVNEGYQLVNSEFGLSDGMIRSYKQAGLWVNLWTVDEAWQYSRLWLAGADSATSNAVREFIPLAHPVFAMPYTVYLIAWGIDGVLAAVLVAVRRK